MLDRIDLHVDVPSVNEDELIKIQPAEESKKIRERIIGARLIQEKRFMYHKKIHWNGEMNVKDIKIFCKLTSDANILLRQSISRLSLSARSYFKIIKVAQTIADLEGSPIINERQIGEALQFRSRDE